MRGGGRGSYERRKKRDFQEEEEGVLIGGGRGSYEKRKNRDFREEEEEGSYERRRKR